MFLLLPFLILIPVITAAADYPPAPPGEVIDDYFGTAVPDPYRWLENVDSEQTMEWIEGQNRVWSEFLDNIPVRDSIRTRLEELYDYERLSMPAKMGERYFYFLNDGLQEHSVLYTAWSMDEEPSVLIDPNSFMNDRLSLTGCRITDDGNLMAWSVSESGSDWKTVYFMDINTGEALEDTLTWLKGRVTWDNNNTGVYYSVYDVPEAGQEYTQQNRNIRVMYHRLGTQQEQDSLIYYRPDKPNWKIGAKLTEDGNYLMIQVYDVDISSRNAMFYIDMTSPERNVVELLDEFNASYSLIGNIGDEFYFLTNLDAPYMRVIKIDLEAPERENWVEIIPETEEVLKTASILNNSRTIVLKYSWEGREKIYLCDMHGNLQSEVALPGEGTIRGFGGYQSDTETYYTFSSFLHPGEVYRYDFQTGESTLLWRPDIDADISQYLEKQVFYESFDGTQVPMFIIYHEGTELDGSNPVLLEGYGGFGISMRSFFRSSLLPWLEMGGIYALPCLRGGEEYGEEWHLAGIMENRPVVFKDFIAAAEYLIEEGYTSTEKLAISGSSNGGTLVAAALNMRPDLFGAAYPAMGVMDLMRFHLFTIGWSWVSEYGDPEDPDDVEFLLDYSPYHNIQEGIEYPPVLIFTADHDDRVVPGHSFKYGARLQAAQGGDAPILMSIISRAGHGGAVGLSEALDKTADRYAFFWQVLEM
ncbi:MAG: S9 family peptidase [Candidatus Aegiribacteria sp.]|nr:S9 family peptidase [Candidatus Aegiribacteria sp.]